MRRTEVFVVLECFILTDDRVTMGSDWRAFEIIINRTF